MLHNRPDIAVIDKKTNECHIVDVPCPVDSRICLKEHEKKEKYTDPAFERKRLWQLLKVRITNIIIGTLVTFSNNLEKYLEDLHIGLNIQSLQKSVLLGFHGNSLKNPGTPRWCHYLLIEYPLFKQ